MNHRRVRLGICLVPIIHREQPTRNQVSVFAQGTLRWANHVHSLGDNRQRDSSTPPRVCAPSHRTAHEAHGQLARCARDTPPTESRRRTRRRAGPGRRQRRVALCNVMGFAVSVPFVPCRIVPRQVPLLTLSSYGRRGSWWRGPSARLVLDMGISSVGLCVSGRMWRDFDGVKAREGAM